MPRRIYTVQLVVNVFSFCLLKFFGLIFKYLLLNISLKKFESIFWEYGN